MRKKYLILPIILFFHLCFAVEFINYTTADGLADNKVRAIVIDSEGNKWFGTGGGVSKFVDNTWTTYTTSDGLVYYDIGSIGIDLDGNIWFGAYAGPGCASKFNDVTWIDYGVATGDMFTKYVYCIVLDIDGKVWFGTSTGVGKYEKNNDMVFCDVYGNHALSMAIDSENNKWFGTGGGVLKSRIEGEISIYTICQMGWFTIQSMQ